VTNQINLTLKLAAQLPQIERESQARRVGALSRNLAQRHFEQLSLTIFKDVTVM
jgi:hypothetical protein